MTVRGIATVVGVGKSSVSRTFQDSWSSTPKRKGKCGLKRGYKSNAVKRSDVETLCSPDHIQQIVIHPSKQFWSFFTTNGGGSLVPFKGIMNYVKYIEILCSRIVPSMETFDGAFQDDLASRHNSTLVQNFIRANKIKVLNGPGNSSDLSPIENL
ncbi:uncharacterized protein TNCV_4859771 [Trichonephila clavipes]|nr:uncharacterized protein TNCV_4859771 [Trichonephila clavipes]